MKKQDMREWVSSLESIIENKLKGWKKLQKIENGRIVQLAWQFEQSHVIIDIFWHDGQETVRLYVFGPIEDHDYTWHGLNNKTFNLVQDRIGNLTQMIMYPPIIPDHG